ncbi:MAG TPA: hypothetical protein VL463_23010 [Kofleriaceae bacterium]|nr:hypothetical protein [Kofleriaceae bacterium]
MKRALALIVVAACGSGDHHTSRRVIMDRASSLREHMIHSVGYGGLWFADPACTQEFPTARTIPEEELDVFARCVAGLHLVPSGRTSKMLDFSMFEYAPGIEVDAQIAEDSFTTQLRWIGYAGSEHQIASLPSITPTALESLRAGGDVEVASNVDGVAWFKLCLDRDGKVTGIHPYASTSPDAERALAVGLDAWKFRPFIAGGAATPACALIMRAHPADFGESFERQVPTAALDPSRFAATLLKRVEGNPTIQPNDRLKIAIQQAGVNVLTGSWRFCIDANGDVDKVETFETTGIPSYDRQIMDALQTWRYAAPVLDGKPQPACSLISFVYHQR